jgi:hypothetical protein
MMKSCETLLILTFLLVSCRSTRVASPIPYIVERWAAETINGPWIRDPSPDPTIAPSLMGFLKKEAAKETSEYEMWPQSVQPTAFVFKNRTGDLMVIWYWKTTGIPFGETGHIVDHTIRFCAYTPDTMQVLELGEDNMSGPEFP